MTNGSGKASDIAYDFVLYDRVLEHGAREALQNYPINVSSATLATFTYRYDYDECKEQVEGFVLDAVRSQCGEAWNTDHPIFSATALPDNNLGYRGQLRSRRRLRQTLRLSQALTRAYSRQGRMRKALQRNDTGTESGEPRVPGEANIEPGRIDNHDSGP